MYLSSSLNQLLNKWRDLCPVTDEFQNWWRLYVSPLLNSSTLCVTDSVSCCTVSYRDSSLSADQLATVRSVAQTKNRRRKQKQRDDDDDDESDGDDDSKEMLESTVTTRRCLRERRKKCRKLSDVDDDNNSDKDYEPESVSIKPKRRKSRRH